MRVLIVEDLKPMRDVARNMLRQMQCFDVIDVTEGGEQAWEKIKEHGRTEPYDLILCDVRMEGLNGIGLLKRCRSHPDYRYLPFLMISASSEKANIAAALGEWQANDFIVKPFSFEVFRKRVETLLKRVQDPEEMLFRQVEQLKESGAPDEAVKLIEQAEMEGRLTLAKWINVKGECLMSAGETHRAADEFEKAMSICTIYVAAYKNYAAAQEKLGNFEKAITALKHAEEISPTDNERTFLLGRLSMQMGKKEEGKKYLENLIRRSSKSEKEATLRTVGQMFLEAGLFLEAERVYTAIIDIAVSDPETYNRLGVALRQQGKYDEALQCYKKALKNHPDHPGIYHNLGVLYAARRDYKTAQSCLQKALSIDPGFEAARAKLETILQMRDLT